MNLLVFDVDHLIENGKGIVRLFCKNEKGKTILVLDSNFKPYFYVEPKDGRLSKYKRKLLDHDFREGKILKVETVEKELFGEKKKLLKIVVETPRDIYNIRNTVKKWSENKEEYEYTISFYQRYLIDKKIKPMKWTQVEGTETKEVIQAKKIKPINLKKEPKLKILAFDIEMIEQDGEEKIIMISLATNTGFKKVLTTWGGKAKSTETVPDEKALLEKFIQTINEQDPDFIVTFNGDGFDFPKIKTSSEKHKINIKIGRDSSNIRLVRRGRISSTKIRGRVHIDLFNFIDHILSTSMKTEVLTLDAVAEELLGLKKRDLKWQKIKESFGSKDGLEELADYCLWDSRLTLKLAEQLLPQVFALSKLTGTIPFDAGRYFYSQLDEAYLMREAFKQNTIIPNSPKQDEIMKRRIRPVYIGGFVIEPKKGIHSDIIVFDFRSLYPTIIVTHNISPGTINCKHKGCKKNSPPELKHHFCKKSKGFIPRNLDDIIMKRFEIKNKMKKLEKDSLEFKYLDNMQYALKIIANSIYGYMGYFGAKWYCYECAATAAAWGRFYIKKSIDMIEKEGFEVIYGDTDSVFITMPGIKKSQLMKRSENFLKKINEQLPGMIQLEFRGIYEGGIFVTIKGVKRGAKKRYALIDKQGNLEIRGFETVRRDWCDLAKDIQHKVLRIILQEKDPDKATKLVRDMIKRLNEKKATLEELTIHTQLVKPLSEYEAIGPHVKVARKMKDRGRPVGEGMIVEYIITKRSGSISDRAEPLDDVKEGEYDPEYYINHQVLPAAMRVLSALGITEQQVLSGKIQARLGKWFKK